MKQLSKKLLLAVILWVVLNCLNFLSSATGQDLPCASKPVNGDSNKIVCVCNATYCDSLGPIQIPSKGQFLMVTSSREGQRLEKSNGSFVQQGNKVANSISSSKNNQAKNDLLHPLNILLETIKVSKLVSPSFKINVTVDKGKRLQKILGFGGAFTDAAGINIATLSAKLQNDLLQSYFDPAIGIGYTLGRVPIGGTDFSRRPYTYDDNQSKIDVNLTNFSLQEEDLKYKIPFIKLAKELQPGLLLYASPWTAPPWMKTNKGYDGLGLLRKKYQSVWANYIVKFLQEYATHGIRMWGLTAQNEPIDGLIPFFPFNCMGWTPGMQRDWIKLHLGPILHQNGFQDLKLMILDDNTVLLPRWAKTVLSDPEASKFVAGIGVHWYSRQISGYKGVKETSELFPDKFILATEACNGFLVWEKNVDLGSWERGEEYAQDIIQQLLHGSAGWTDWNLALDMDGGPNWANLGADSPIIIDSKENVFYKQPMFYVLAQFAKFLTRNSQIVSVQMLEENGKNKKWEDGNFLKNIFAVAAIREDNLVVLVLLNKNEHPIIINLFEENGTAVINIPPKSVSTIMYPS